MLPKPKHLEAQYGAQFQDLSIVEAYPNRPPYPLETFEILTALIQDEPRAVLDIGCGTGDIARLLVNLVERVDAVDISQPMLTKGRQLPNGDNVRLRWICSSVEEATLASSYALITAGESLHWMEWQIVLPRFRQLLTSHGYLAIVGRAEQPIPWRDELFKLLAEFTTNKDYQPYNVVDELEKRQLFRRMGQRQTSPTPFSQSIPAYIEAIHSRNGFSRERMTPTAVATFDAQYHALLKQHCPDGYVHLEVIGTIDWGIPL